MGGLAVQDAPDIAHYVFGGVLRGVPSGGVGGHCNAGMTPEGVGGGQGLLVEDVNCCRCDVARIDCDDEVVINHVCPAR